MSEHQIKKARKCVVTHEFGGKRHFFKVESPSGKTYNPIIQVSCQCEYMSIQGSANAEICPHILAVLGKISEIGNIKLELR